jgi:hypothetical protein
VAEPVIDWLLEGDPAIRWQAMRDLLDAPDDEVERERAKIAREGWGAALLARQDPDGRWAGGLYGPKWTSTFYTLLTLTALGLPRGHQQALRGSEILLEKGLGADGGLDYSRPRRALSELCVTGMGLRIMAAFLGADEGLQPLVRCLLATQLPDGGWNCQRDSRHGSFNTTISALEGLREWSAATGRGAEVEAAAAGGREFLLQHRMFRSHRTGEVAKEQFARFSFPYHWHYDVLRGLDYFQSANAPHDERLQDAIDLVNAKRRKDGRWTRQNRHAGQEFFEMEPAGQPSRWNTLRGLRVLRWWEGG